MIKELRQKIAQWIAPTDNNSMSFSNDFLKYGGKQMSQDWTEVKMSDKDLYTNYGYAVINNRSNTVARVATEHVRTESGKKNYIHPYLDLIENSEFAEDDFWSNISTYLDLEGVYYLMAVRNFDGKARYGNIQKLVLLNPYNVTKVYKQDTLELGGYLERVRGLQREIPVSMIIEIRDLNPFDKDTPYSMTDAAKENQFTMKTAGDYTRKTIKHNMGAPGILSTGVVLSDEKFANFQTRVKNHTKGEPLFGNGSEAVTWTSMQTDLSKTALKEVNDLNRESLFSIGGVSKTIMGIEESGTTRDTSRIQEELNMKNHIIPRIKRIINALNLDYKTKYPQDYAVTKAKLVVDNPLATDHEAELKEVEVSEKRFDLKQKMINAGVDPDLASSYVSGDVGIDQIDIEKAEPVVVDPVVTDVKKKKNRVDNGSGTRSVALQQEGSLMNAVQNIDSRLLSFALNRLRKRNNEVEVETEKQVVTKKEKNELTKELTIALATFYGIIVNLRGNENMNERVGKYVMPGFFTFSQSIVNKIKNISDKVAESHVNTMANEIYETARKAAVAGKSLSEVESELKTKFVTEVSDARAKVVARTETNRAFTMGQYEADIQFIAQNSLESRAFKRWICRSSKPCQYCLALQAEGEVPFSTNFRSLGDKVTVGDTHLLVNFIALSAGNAHPNCACEYELIIRPA